VYKRVVTWTLLALLVLSGATFGTARARQVASVNDAHNRSALARVEATQNLARATRDGMSAPELAPYQRRLQALAAVHRPQAMPLWDPSSASFYDRQGVAYRQLSAAIRSGEARALVAAKARASSSLFDLSREIGTAGSLDLDITSAQKMLAAQQTLLATARTIGALRSLAAAATAARTGLAGPTEARLQSVRSLVAKAGGNLKGVLTAADAETQNAQSSLTLLGLLTPRAQTYGTALTSLDATVHAQTTAFAAAVKEGPLRAEVQKVAADYAKTVPAKMIVVSTENQHADLYENSRIVYSTDVTTGGPELPTDHGVFHIYFKASPFEFHSPWPVGSPYYYFPTPVQFWMPFDGGEGLHDASWRSNFGPGSNLAPTDLGTGNSILGTHGCVNLPTPAAQFVWDWAPVGTTVVVI
jgi:lipoprotein-anchoring transpeptidase ErfK/SrfK